MDESNSDEQSNCSSCGAGVSGDLEGCRKLFDEVIAREFSDFRYGKVHRMTVDAYSLQHPDRYLKSFTSHAAHLTGLCWAFDYDGSQRIGNAIKKWLDTHPEKQKIPAPVFRGNMTILDVYNARDAGEHTELVKKWAWEAWQAWSFPP